MIRGEDIELDVMDLLGARLEQFLLLLCVSDCFFPSPFSPTPKLSSLNDAAEKATAFAVEQVVVVTVLVAV